MECWPVNQGTQRVENGLRRGSGAEEGDGMGLLGVLGR